MRALGPAGQALNVMAVLQLLGGGPAAAAGQGELICPRCGLEYPQFRAAGRLGCPDDYEAFIRRHVYKPEYTVGATAATKAA